MTETTAPTVLRANNPADFLAALPRITGMDATECAFIVMFDGKRTIGAARIDLPPLDQFDQPGLELVDWLGQVTSLASSAAAAVPAARTEQELSEQPATRAPPDSSRSMPWLHRCELLNDDDEKVEAHEGDEWARGQDHLVSHPRPGRRGSPRPRGRARGRCRTRAHPRLRP